MRRRFAAKLLIVLLLSAAVVTVLTVYLRPVPGIEATVFAKKFAKDQSVSLPWPTYGQAALGAVGYGVLETHGQQNAVPIASIAKVVTALSVLEKKPLAVGDKGPEIILTSADVQLFEDYYSRGGSVVKVQNGEKITEYEALQALLLPSANNIADSLARWAFGSVLAYTEYANKLIGDMGLAHTRLADASGFSPDSVSTAQELVQIAQKVLSNPVLAQIVSQQKATLPVAGEVSNVNWLLGTDEVVGIKTGNTDEAGGCFMFAANRQIEGRQVKIVGAVLGAPSRDTAIGDSRPIIAAAGDGFENKIFIKAGEAIGLYQSPWGALTTAVAKDDVSALVWKGSASHADIKLKIINTEAGANTEAGTITVTSGQQKAVRKAILSQPVSGPDWQWRLTHAILD